MNLIQTLKDALGPRENYHDENLTDEEKSKKAAIMAAYHRVQDLQSQVAKLLLEERPFRWANDGWNGHFKNGAYWNLQDQTENSAVVGDSRWGGNWLKNNLKEILAWKAKLSQEECERILNNVALSEPVVLGSTYQIECPYCGTKPKIAWDGNFRLIAEPCPRPEGIPVTEFELNVPSGKIVMDDDLRHWFPTATDRDINKTIGIHLQILDYAAAGFACGFVGNSCPAVFKDGDKLSIGNWPDEIPDPNADPDSYEYIENPEECPWGEQVGSICTDLWWYSIADFDEFKRRFAHYTPDADFDEWLNFWTHHVAEVKPGVYRFKHYTEADRDASITLYAEFEWVREPDPVRDLLGEDAVLDLNAVECCIQSAINYPTLYMPQRKSNRSEDYDFDRDYDDRLTWPELTREQKMWALARTADQFMCTLGGGVEWHPNGFPRTVVSAEARKWAKEFAEEEGLPVGVVPSFAGMAAHWYPISEGYAGLCLGAGIGNSYRPMDEPMKLNESFILLALNVAQSFIENPGKPQLNDRVWPPTYGTEHVMERRKLALKAYRKLRKLYPDLVMDEAFDQWAMRTTKRAPKMEPGDLVALRQRQWRLRETTGAKPKVGGGDPLPAGRLVYWGPVAGTAYVPPADSRIERPVQPPSRWRIWARNIGHESLELSNPFEGPSGLETFKVVAYLGDHEDKGFVRIRYTGANGHTEDLRVHKEMISTLPKIDDYIKDDDYGPAHPPKKRWPAKPGPFYLSEKGGFVEFDASKVESMGGENAYHAHETGGWANPGSATRYALVTRSNEGDYWSAHANTNVPLKFVARISEEARTSGSKAVEIEFDYGDDKMVGSARKRWALREVELQGVRHFTDEAEYKRLVEEYAKS